ncbi:CIR protein PIR protein [Plasmodium vinckei lentum]|uniref:CIR protein PIR protein n=1 Tax=Plasmodium vinckei lentum TaxID=138297 RepID=A0A6V7SSQ5_PLAVN|nr:CIR protein PIR protein [Plasmodium vinckei lentum]
MLNSLYSQLPDEDNEGKQRNGGKLLYETYCPKVDENYQKCNSDHDRIKAGFIYLVGQLFGNVNSDGEHEDQKSRYVYYGFMWMSYKLQQSNRNSGNSITLYEFINNHVLKDEWYEVVEEYVEPKVPLITKEADIDLMSDVYYILKEMCKFFSNNHESFDYLEDFSKYYDSVKNFGENILKKKSNNADIDNIDQIYVDLYDTLKNVYNEYRNYHFVKNTQYDPPPEIPNIEEIKKNFTPDLKTPNLKDSTKGNLKPKDGGGNSGQQQPEQQSSSKPKLKEPAPQHSKQTPVPKPPEQPPAKPKSKGKSKAKSKAKKQQASQQKASQQIASQQIASQQIASQQKASQSQTQPVEPVQSTDTQQTKSQQTNPQKTDPSPPVPPVSPVPPVPPVSPVPPAPPSQDGSSLQTPKTGEIHQKGQGGPGNGKGDTSSGSGVTQDNQGESSGGSGDGQDNGTGSGTDNGTGNGTDNGTGNGADNGTGSGPGVSKIGQKTPDSDKGNKDGGTNDGANGGAGTPGSGANGGNGNSGGGVNGGDSSQGDQGNTKGGLNNQGNPSGGSNDQGNPPTPTKDPPPAAPTDPSKGLSPNKPSTSSTIDPPSTPAPNPSSTTPKDPTQQKQPSPQPQHIIQHPTQTNSSNHQTVGQFVKSLSSDLILKKPWNIFPTTWNGSGDCKPEIKFMNTTLVCCTSEQCSLTGISVTLILIPIILLIAYKYLSFGSSKKSEKKNMKRVINFHDGNIKTKIIISSYDKKKKLKPVINSVDGKKGSLLNICKLIRADPMPFINLFFLLIFFVYKRKRDTIE